MTSKIVALRYIVYKVQVFVFISSLHTHRQHWHPLWWAGTGYQGAFFIKHPEDFEMSPISHWTAQILSWKKYLPVGHWLEGCTHIFFRNHWLSTIADNVPLWKFFYFSGWYLPMFMSLEVCLVPFYWLMTYILVIFILLYILFNVK